MGYRAGHRGERVGACVFRRDTRGATRKRWLVLPALVSAFLLQHSVQGWCPPIRVLRRLGFRTSFKIEEERQALKAIRGDYRTVQPGDGRSVLQAVRA